MINLDYRAIPCNKDEDMTPGKIEESKQGVKYDQGKVMGSLLREFSRALMAVAEVGTFGAEKYTRGGWLTVPNGETRYSDAMWRHLLLENQEMCDGESGLRHSAHAAWNALARLELELQELAKYDE